jgi:hypothetical protein
MIRRITASALLLLVLPFAGGCYCYRPFLCHRPFFFGGYAGGCCDPCASGYSPAPATPVPPGPIYGPVPAQAGPAMAVPTTNPPIERIRSFETPAMPTGIRR